MIMLSSVTARCSPFILLSRDIHDFVKVPVIMLNHVHFDRYRHGFAAGIPATCERDIQQVN